MLVLRKLNQKRHWDKPLWLGEEEVQADATKCLTSCDNAISVYIIEEADGNIDRVVAALAAKRDHLKHFDLAIVSSDALNKCEIEASEVPGKTDDFQVNDWHKDLINLSFRKICDLASCIRLEGTIRRYQKREVEKAIASSLQQRVIAAESIRETLSSSLRSRGII